MPRTRPKDHPMTQDEALAALAQVRQAMHEQFPDHPARLAQLDGALATAGMAVEHLHDEQARHSHNPRAHAKALGEYVKED